MNQFESADPVDWAPANQRGNLTLEVATETIPSIADWLSCASTLSEGSKDVAFRSLNPNCISL